MNSSKNASYQQLFKLFISF